MLKAFFAPLKEVGSALVQQIKENAANAPELSEKQILRRGASPEAESSMDAMDYQQVVNEEIMNHQHMLNETSAQNARDFSEMQRTTQYQTAVDDLKKAGLNPALAFQNGTSGAGVTGSSSASVSSQGVTNPFGQIASAAINSAASIANNAITNQTNLQMNTDKLIATDRIADKDRDAYNTNSELNRWFGLASSLVGLGSSALSASIRAGLV